jgi:hypothetical protein
MTLVLLFVGIHNAWDTVTYIVVGASQPRSDSKPAERPKPKAGTTPANP